MTKYSEIVHEQKQGKQDSDTVVVSKEITKKPESSKNKIIK